MKSLESVLTDYQTLIDYQKSVEEKYRSELDRIKQTKHKIKAWLNENVGEFDVPEEIVLDDPQLAWEMSKKNDALAIKMHMLVDDEILPKLEAEYDEQVKPLKALKAEIENWGLTQLLERKAKNFKSAEGTGSLRTDVKYQVADKSLFLNWCSKNKAENEITVTIRPNSKFFAQVVENNGELPEGLSQFREQKCVYVKGKEK